MRKLLFPLRTNAGWFESAANLDALRRRLKAALILYDKVLLQDGRYKCVILKNGSFDMVLSPSQLGSADRSKISFLQPGGRAKLSFSPTKGGDGTALLDGEALAFLDADFWPLIEEAGIRKYSGVEIFAGDWTDELKAEVKKLERKHSQGLISAQKEGERFQKSKWAEVYLTDAMAAYALKLPVAMDERAAPLANWVRDQSIAQLRDEVPPIFLHEWIQIGLPDFTSDPWDKILEIRDSQAGVAFRRLIYEIESQILADAPDIKNADEIGEIVRQKLTLKLVDEIFERRTTLEGAVVSLGMNFTPVGLMGNVQEFWDALKEERSWINLLKGN